MQLIELKSKVNKTISAISKLTVSSNIRDKFDPRFEKHEWVNKLLVISGDFQRTKKEINQHLNRLKRWILKTMPLTSLSSNILELIVRLLLRTHQVFRASVDSLSYIRSLRASMDSLRPNHYRRCTSFLLMKGLSGCGLGECCSSNVSQFQ